MSNRTSWSIRTWTITLIILTLCMTTFDVLKNHYAPSTDNASIRLDTSQNINYPFIKNVCLVPNKQALATSENHWQVMAYFNEKTATSLAPNQIVEISLSSHPGKIFRGKISKILPVKSQSHWEQLVRNIPVIINFNGYSTPPTTDESVHVTVYTSNHGFWTRSAHLSQQVSSYWNSL